MKLYSVWVHDGWGHNKLAYQLYVYSHRGTCGLPAVHLTTPHVDVPLTREIAARVLRESLADGAVVKVRQIR